MGANVYGQRELGDLTTGPKPGPICELWQTRWNGVPTARDDVAELTNVRVDDVRSVVRSHEAEFGPPDASRTV